MNYFVITLPEPNAKAWKQLSLEATGSNWKQLEATGSNYISRNPSQAFTRLSEREGAEREGAEREGAERRDY